MDTAGSRTRRSARALLLGSALAALLTVTTAGAASGAHPADTAGQLGSGSAASAEGSGAGTLANTDVWMKDHDSDVGVAPHTIDNIYWSPDIKVCHTPVECADSQNPIVGVTNYIFVTLRNPGPYGTGTASGYLYLYRTIPGGGTVWPSGWASIAAAAVTVPAGTTTVMVPWVEVPGPGHFCLLARWVSNTDPMNAEGPVTTTNTRNNNNIAWRNVDTVALPPGGDAAERPFAIGNALRTETRNDIVFTQRGGDAFGNVGGQVTVDLGQTLFERWREGGARGTNVRPIGGTEVAILDPAKASLNGLRLKPGERLAFRIKFSAKELTRKPILLNVAQFGPEKENGQPVDLGGVLYQVNVGQVRD